MASLFTQLALSAQTAFAELLDAARVRELSRSISSLHGSFAHKTVKGREYWYFAYRDLDGSTRQLYVGPDAPRLRALMDADRPSDQTDLLPQARSALALGCAGVVPRHFRIIRRLSEYGFFRAGGVLIGTHAFVSLGNLLGVTFSEASRTLDLDFAHAGKNVSLALPSTIKVDVQQAIDSLEMGFLPMIELDGQRSGTLANPREPDFRIDFLTSAARERVKPIFLPDLNIPLQPLSHLEFILEAPEQSLILGSEGAVVVNVPAPARLAVHKLIVSSLRSGTGRAKASKDIAQAAALIQVLADSDPAALRTSWKDALGRGPKWKKRAQDGRQRLARAHPELAQQL